MDRNYIVELIKENRLQEALKAIEKASKDKHLKNEIIMLSSTYSEYAKANRTAAQDYETLEMQRAKITSRLLSILDEISPEDLEEVQVKPNRIAHSPHSTPEYNPSPSQATPSATNKLYMYIASGLVVLAAIYMVVPKGTPTTPASTITATTATTTTATPASTKTATPATTSPPQPNKGSSTNTNTGTNTEKVNPISSNYAKLENSLLHQFQRTPVQNDYHVGSISRIPNSGGKLRWTNKTGVSWTLTPDYPNQVLRTEDDSPYQKTGPREFTLVIENGQVTGFKFANELYKIVD